MLKRTVVAALAACGVWSVQAATTISEPTTLNEKQTADTANWSPLTINADLKIADGGQLYIQ